MSKKKLLLASVVAVFLALAGLGVQRYYIEDSNEPESTQQQQSPSQNSPEDNGLEEADPTASNKKLSEQNKDEVNNPRPEEGEPNKTPVSSIVEEAPSIYTGFGHSGSNPLPTGSNTSTSCTTSPNVECKIRAEHTDDSSQTYEFETKTTNSEGVALWSWTGGSELTSGAWKLYAVVGDKESQPETIFIQ